MAQTYAQLQKQIALLRAEADSMRDAERADAIAKVKESIGIWNLTAKDLFGRQLGKRTAKRSIAAKYADGKGNEWSGRGPRPKWLRAAMEAGKSLEDFIGGSARSDTAAASEPAAPDAAPAPRPRTPAKKAAGKKRGSKAKYGDSSGNRWSGMGPKPRWLKEAIAGGKALEDFVV